MGRDLCSDHIGGTSALDSETLDNMLIVRTSMVLMSPWIICNCIETHGSVLMRDAFGVNIWCSNNDNAHVSAQLTNSDSIGRTTYP